MPKKPAKSGLPTREQILDFIQTSDEPAGKREIARAFGLKGQDKIALKQLLRDMGDEGLIDSAPGRAFHRMGGLPKVTVLRVVDVDEAGRAVAVPERWEADGEPPRLRVMERKGRGPALAPGDRILSRTEEGRSGWVAHPMKKLLKGSELVLGVIHREGTNHWLKPVDRKEKRELPISDLGDAAPGDLVLAEKVGRPPRLAARVDTRLGDPFAPRSFSLIAIHKYGIPHEFPERVLAEADETAGRPLDSDGPSPDSARAEPVEARSLSSDADKESPSTSSGRTGGGARKTAQTGTREDLTHIPIVAIDPADARDHDDAVWAAPDDDPGNQGGWRAIVAIADVSFYVRPGSALEREARKRGNSVYFPDRVVPMLPESLSAEICSLKAGEDRAALVCHLQVTKDGQLKSWRFARARVRIVANIAYEDAQAAIDLADGRSAPSCEELEDRAEAASSPCAFSEADMNQTASPVAPELVESTLRPLWACWRALYAAREKRGPLELELPERRVMLDETGRITSVAPRERLDAHKLIEDYMIAANVAAAKALEAKKSPVMYRVHEPPGREKLVALRDYLKTFGIEFALGQVVRPSTFNRLIERARSMSRPGEGRGSEDEGERAPTMKGPGDGGDDGEAAFLPQIMEQILRTQTQAYYGPQNHGHFGLALGSYAHFTSPIRRYADLVVHRALVRAYRLGPDARETGLADAEAESLEVTGELISNLERRAMEAERDTLDRYVAAYLADHVGELVECRITGVQPFGFFATVLALGGDGLVPVSTLGREYYRYDEASQSLVGEESGTIFAPGQRLTLRLAEADPIVGGLRFELPETSDGSGRGRPPRDGRREGPPRRRPQGRRGRPANIRHQGKRR